MKFLNGKEEVIDIEITSYGRHLISKGKFKPQYYSFFDDGILYDNEYAGITEAQNDAQNRIKNDTPRLQAQTNYAGSETSVKKLAENFEFEKIPARFTVETPRSAIEIALARRQGISVSPTRLRTIRYEYTQITPKTDQTSPAIQADADKFYSLKYPIGSSDLNTNNAPSWNISVLNNVISSSSNHLTGAFISEKIPQLNIYPIEYETIVGKIPPNSDTTSYDYVFDNVDGTPENFINITPGDNELIFSIAEENTFFGEQNFDIEVYRVENETFQGKVKQNMIPLYFTKKIDLVKNNILLDENSDEVAQQDASREIISQTEGDLSELQSLELDPSYVEYYFYVDTDSDIDDETLCKLTVDKSQGIFSERYLDCAKIEKQNQFDNSRVFDTDDSVNKVGDCE
jgi:hypothetical protein